MALIPKIKIPSEVGEFQPINLYNVLYKLISKVPVKKLKKVIENIADEG